ncbi:Hsp33 family molecular chaperone HslO [Nannocystis bainbridge]|uniref:Hsp33 family molecular chaperone HslO n=1 Tax=Nannocystis bainbridge TaxID=2995303 RepID=A0ABT5DZK3_9BACT|nr:Hsp33 family molecular chaperone HslO [Nannocystis bainbridge]MDC0718494.1 Hsp33 family molecular chaperone HslO [Nannocystis bainbridge]
MDVLLRAIAAAPDSASPEQAAMRALAAVTTDLVQESCRRHGIRGLEAIALGRALTAGCLLTTLTKSPVERLRVDARSVLDSRGPGGGEGEAGGFLLDAHGDGTVRGCLRRGFGDTPLRATLERASGRLPLSPFLGRRGVLTVTRDFDMSAGTDSRYQGTVELVAGEVDVDLEHYLNASEQVPSLLRCEVLLDANGDVLRAGGLLVQTLPGSDGEVLAPLRQRVGGEALASLLMLPREPADLLRLALADGPFEVVGETPLAFRCNCGPAVARDIVAMLGADDVEALAGEREITEVRCSYCGERYHVTAAELRELAAELRLKRS